MEARFSHLSQVLPLSGNLEPIFLVVRVGSTFGLLATIRRLSSIFVSRTKTFGYGVGHLEGPHPYYLPYLLMPVVMRRNCDRLHTSVN